VGGALKKGAKWVKGKPKGLKNKFDGMKAKRKAKKDAKKKGKEDPSKKKKDKEDAKRRKRDAAIARVKPKINALLSKGIGRFWLMARLGVLGLTNGLKSLSLKGKAIVGRASPEFTIDSVDNAVLGSMLEPILVKAEAAYLRRYDQSRTHEAQGKEAGIHHMPSNKDTSQIKDLRAMRDSGQAARAKGASPPLNTIKATAQGPTLWWRDTTSLAMAQVNKVAGMENIPLKYALMIEDGRLKDVPISALTDQQRQFFAALGSVEIARKKGMMPAMDLASTLHQEGVIKSAEGVIAGDAAPMGRVNSALAAHRDDGYVDYTKRKPEDLEDFQKASEVRRERIGYIFKQLRNLITENRSILTNAGGAAQGVAKAFDAWFNASVSGLPSDRYELIKATQNLVKKLVVFLKTYRT
jgi:hypothetical protein